MKLPTRLRRVRTEEYNAAVSASVNDDHQLSIQISAIKLLLPNNVENFTEGFRCEACQNTAGARIEAERLTPTHNFWRMGSLKVGRKFTSLSKNCVQR